MEDCIFCKIVAGEIPCAKIYEDDNVIAFLDLFPVTRGHALVVPKKHTEDIYSIEEDELGKVMLAVKKLSVKIKEALSVDGVRISQSNGSHAGQAIFHLHVHIIPRYKDDGVNMSEITTAHPAKADFEELKKIAEKINS